MISDEFLGSISGAKVDFPDIKPSRRLMAVGVRRTTRWQRPEAVGSPGEPECGINTSHLKAPLCPCSGGSKPMLASSVVRDRSFRNPEIMICAGIYLHGLPLTCVVQSMDAIAT
jgi:hypothetical protein